MWTFRRFLSELAEPSPFPGLPNVEVMSLDAFVRHAPQTAPNASDEPLGEADGDDTFGLGATTRVPSDAEMQAYLQRIFNREKTRKDKFILPYIHRRVLQPVKGGSLLLKPGSDVVLDPQKGDTIDADDLKRTIRVRPTRLVSRNRKMLKSSGGNLQFYNFGLPALTGLALNERTNEFVIVNTCPGAGACQMFCYALKGGYVQWMETNLMQTRVLNFLLNDPKGFFAQVKAEIADAYRRTQRSKERPQLVVRWHDAGDFFSETYKNYFYDVVRTFPDVRFYAYTKLASVAQDQNAPENFTINFSDGAKPGQQKHINLKDVKHSTVVPKEMFADLMHRVAKVDEKGKEVSSLQFKSKNDFQTFKQRLADTYDIDPKTILTYDQMMAKPLRNDQPNTWNVIVVPGEGDVSASRRDVQRTLLLFH